MKEISAPEALAEAAKEPTLDEYLRRDPATLSEADLRKLIEIERKRRAMFIEGEAQKKAKKAGDEPSKSNEEEDDADAN